MITTKSLSLSVDGHRLTLNDVMEQMNQDEEIRPSMTTPREGIGSIHLPARGFHSFLAFS